MDELYQLYQEWYKRFSARHVVENVPWSDYCIALELSHDDSGAIVKQTLSYEMVDDILVSWKAIHHGVWLLTKLIENDGQSWLNFRLTATHNKRVVHNIDVLQAYTHVYNFLSHLLDEGVELQKFLSGPISDELITSRLHNVDGWDVEII